MDLIGSGYVTEMRKRLNAYRKFLRPRGKEDKDDLVHGLNLLGEDADPDISKANLRKMLRIHIKKVFTPNDIPLSKLSRARLMDVAKFLQDNIQGKARNFDPNDEQDYIDKPQTFETTSRKSRSDKDVKRGKHGGS